MSTYIEQRHQAKQHGVGSETRSYQRADRLSLVPKMDPSIQRTALVKLVAFFVVVLKDHAPRLFGKYRVLQTWLVILTAARCSDGAESLYCCHHMPAGHKSGKIKITPRKAERRAPDRAAGPRFRLRESGDREAASAAGCTGELRG